MSPRRRRLRLRREPSLEREFAAIRAHLDATLAELDTKRARVGRLERELREHAETRPAATLFRLHSATHHLHCSDRQFARFAGAQRSRPVLVTKKDGRRWWWFRDRFWWDDTGLTAGDVETIVRDADLLRRREADDRDRTLKAVFGKSRHRQEHQIPVAVRAVVWARDDGRCVDCGSGNALAFDLVVPLADRESASPANVELRCSGCRERRAHDQARAREMTHVSAAAGRRV